MGATNKAHVWLSGCGRRFHDRAAAGRALSALLTDYVGRADALVLALPRGGVPVGFEVARALGAPLDIILVRKLGAPGQEELALGAIAEGGLRALNEDLVGQLGLDQAQIGYIAERAQGELARRARSYRGDRPAPDLRGRTVILVDDGLATGATMRVAAAAVWAQEARSIVVAVPVAPRETVRLLRRLVDRVLVAEIPQSFSAIGLWYDDFAQLDDEAVRALLRQSSEARSVGRG